MKRTRPEKKDYRAILDAAELEALRDRIAAAGSVSLDTETDSAFPTRARLVGMSFALVPGEAFYLPLGHDYLGAPAQVPLGRALGILRPVLEDPAVRKTGQNIKYDTIVLRREGVRLAGIDRDTMVLSYLLEPNWGKHNLERLALTYLQETKAPYESVVGKGKNQTTMDKVAVDRVVPYACQDADLALELGDLLWEKVRERKLDRLYETIERPLIGLLAEMEIWGVRVDPDVLRAMSARVRGRAPAPREGDPRAGRRAVQHQLPPAARRRPLPQAGAPGGAEDPRHPRLLDLARHPRGAGAAPPPGPARPRVPPEDEAQVDLRRRPAGAHRPADGAHPHVLQPDRGLHGPPVVERPKPPEHPGPGRMGAALPPRLHRRPRLPAPGRRLLPDRAADPGPPQPGRGPGRDIRRGPGRP